MQDLCRPAKGCSKNLAIAYPLDGWLQALNEVYLGLDLNLHHDVS